MTVALEEAQSGDIDRPNIRLQALNLFLVGFLVLFSSLHASAGSRRTSSSFSFSPM